jgi:hypothetical protein
MPDPDVEPLFDSRTPKAGTVERAAWDAMHAVWCGPECETSCRQWHPDRREIRAAIAAVREYDRA